MYCSVAAIELLPVIGLNTSDTLRCVSIRSDEAEVFVPLPPLVVGLQCVSSLPSSCLKYSLAKRGGRLKTGATACTSPQAFLIISEAYPISGGANPGKIAGNKPRRTRLTTRHC